VFGQEGCPHERDLDATIVQYVRAEVLHVPRDTDSTVGSAAQNAGREQIW
jgi:hypothetical protein